jgi:adenylate kinase
MRLVLLGPPGAGKGTQAKEISAHLGIPAISTGDIFRANVAAGSPLGLEARRYMDAGDYVPDEVTNQMVAIRLGEADCAPGFLLDGYPRTVAQVDELDRMLAGRGHQLDAVVDLEVDPEEVVRRLRGRGRTEGRVDDSEDVIRRRLQVFADKTAPLARKYAERGILRQVDGSGDVTEVTKRILGALDATVDRG